MTRYGTNHFVDLDAALNYYGGYMLPPEEVQRKIDEQEIVIGKPFTPHKLTVIDGRYHIEEKS